MSLSGSALGFNQNDTIAAIATAPGPAGISVIRIAGSKAFAVTEKIFRGKIKLSQAKTHTIHYGTIFNPQTKELVDEVLVSIFTAPHSYTGEDMVEISCHGGDFVASQILKLIIKLNVRLAEPGEFTKRRVLAGKMDITQAEAILDLVQARDLTTYRSAIEQLQGKLSGYIQSLSKELTTIIAQIENLLEFEDNHKHVQVKLKEIKKRLSLLREKIEKNIKQNETLQFFRKGISCVIVGRPNVGKSSLFNRLGETEKAIVTEIPGTTRDSLEQTIAINGLILHLIDTAGLKVITESKGTRKIEAIGIEKSKNWLETADLVLAVFDNSQAVKKEDRLVYQAVRNKPHISVLNKIDLKQYFPKKFFNREKIYPISAKYNKGIEQLKNAIVSFYKRKLSSNLPQTGNYFYLNARHIEALTKVATLLKQAEQEEYLDASIMNLRTALDNLGTITGTVTNEQILDIIFQKFCVGK